MSGVVPLESIVRAALAGEDLGGLLERYQQESGASPAESSDRLMVAIARQFLAHALTYSEADKVANRWWAWMCDPERLASQSIPDLAYSVFGAFDAGEYDHGDGYDPVKFHTIPLLHSALAEDADRQD